MSEAREEILRRVREANAGKPDAESPPPIGHAAAGGDLPALFAERVGDFRATVTRVQDGVAEAVGAAAARAGARRLAVARGLPPEWLPGGLDLPEEPELSVADLDAVDGVITGCALAIAETGTIVLDGGAGQGPRRLTLIPDLHVCVVREDQLVNSVPDAVAALGEAAAAGRPLTFVSGPSATSDIELERVEGVHGPRTLEVVLVRTA